MAINQKASKAVPDENFQVLYLERWVDRQSFRAFVYDKDNNQKLARSWDEYNILISSGVWFSTTQGEKFEKELNKNKSEVLSKAKEKEVDRKKKALVEISRIKEAQANSSPVNKLVNKKDQKEKVLNEGT